MIAEAIQATELSHMWMEKHKTFYVLKCKSSLRKNVCICMYMYVCICMYMYVFMYVYIYMYIYIKCICAYICIYMRINNNRQQKKYALT